MQTSQVFDYIGEDGVLLWFDKRKQSQGNHKVLFSAIERMLNLTLERCYPSCETAKELCNKFADFFSGKIATIRSNLGSLALPDIPFRFSHFDNPPIQCEFNQFKAITAVELSKLITKMARKSCSLDPIPSNLLKLCFSDLVPIITKIVNRSLVVKFLCLWKGLFYLLFLKNPPLTLSSIQASDRYRTSCSCPRCHPGRLIRAGNHFRLCCGYDLCFRVELKTWSVDGIFCFSDRFGRGFFSNGLQLWL